MAFIYARVSTARQEAEGYSLEAQLELCREYARRLNLDIEQEFVEVESASSTGRPRFAAMLRELRRRQGVVVAQSTDRLYRNLEDAEALGRTGADVHLVHEGGQAQTKTAMGRFTGRLKASLAALYSDRLGEEARKGMGAKAAKGLWPTRAPIGYVNTSRQGVRVIEPDPELAPLVRELFLRCAQGEGTDALHAWAKASGLRKRGAVRPLSRSRIGYILGHAVYCGKVPWQGELYDGHHEPLVSEAEWQAAREALTGRRRKPRQGRRRFHVYGGKLMKCAGCGASVMGETKRQRHGYVYVYYRCSGRRGPCPRKYVREEDIEARVRECFSELRMTDAEHALLLRLIRKLALESGQAVKDERARLRRQVRTLEDRIERSHAAYLDGVSDARTHMEASGRWRSEIAAAEARLEELRTMQAHDEGTAIGLLEVARGASETLAEMPGDVRRDVVGFYGSVWLLEPNTGSVHVEWRDAVRGLARTSESGSSSGLEDVSGHGRPVWLPEQDRARTCMALLAQARPHWLDAALRFAA